MPVLFGNMENENDEMLFVDSENQALWRENPENQERSIGGFLLNHSLSEAAGDSLD